MEIKDPDLKVEVVDEGVVFTDADGKPVEVGVGKHELEVTYGNLHFTTKSFTVKKDGEVVVNVELLRGKVRVTADGRVIGDEKLPDLRRAPGAAITETALVGDPATVEGVGSWTVETVRHRGAVKDLAISPDDRLLATCGVDGSVRLWSMETLELEKILLHHIDEVHSLAWSPGGGVLASASVDGKIAFWMSSRGG